MTSRDIMIVAAKRSAIGDFGGALKSVAPSQMAAKVMAATLESAQVDPARVGTVVMGHVIHTEARDMYLSRVASIEAGLPVGVPAMNVNRLCGSSLQALVSAAQSILLGDTDTAIAAGAECMSRSGYLMPAARWGARLGDSTMVDMMVGALTDPFGNGHMGITAENVAKRYNLSREAQDEYAVLSHMRANQAWSLGHFDSQIVPISVKVGKELRSFVKDEHPRSDVTVEGLAKLRPAFDPHGTVTAGNASSLNDGAASVVLMEARACNVQGIKPMARVVSYGHSGVDPAVMGLGPIGAVRQALARAGLNIDDMDVIESNEAFASQAMAVAQDLEMDPAKLNPNGGAIALGHPIGATGAILVVKAVHELIRIQGRYGLCTMCIGGGQGIAVIIERV